MKKNRISVIGVLPVMLWAGTMLIGCGAPTKHYGSLSIVSEPPNAQVVNLKDRSAIGTTPMQYTWETGSSTEEYIQLMLTAPGNVDQVTSLFLNARYDDKDTAEKNPQAIKVNVKQAR
jgi:hypothetical protein